MEKELLEKLKEKLIAKQGELVASISNRNVEASELKKDDGPGDEVDAASFAVDGYLLNKLGAMDAEKLNQINAALNRMSQGTYGVCLDCEKEIPEPRLNYIPWAAYCVECQGKHDRMY